MFNTFRTAIYAGAIAMSALTAVSSAQASIDFHNVTDNPIKFEITCGDGMSLWTVQPHATESLYCTNHVYPALVKITTDRGDHDEVVRLWVSNHQTYQLDYDTDGDVNIW